MLNEGQQVKLVISIPPLGRMKALKSLKQKAAISCWRSDEIIDLIQLASDGSMVDLQNNAPPCCINCWEKQFTVAPIPREGGDLVHRLS